jgi:uncharacterized protein YlbG (UPF0298 family)
VCFTEDGKVKIWVNSNLVENRVEKRREKRGVKNMEECNRMYVNKIYEMVEKKTRDQEKLDLLKNKFREKNPETYF